MNLIQYSYCKLNLLLDSSRPGIYKHPEGLKSNRPSGGRVAKGDDLTEQLLSASYDGDIVAVQVALDAGTSVLKQNAYGDTALHYAVVKGNPDILDLLIGYGATIDAKNGSNSTPLHIAAMHGRLEAVKRLITAGSVANRNPESPASPASWARQEGHFAVSEWLKSHSTEERDKGKMSK